MSSKRQASWQEVSQGYRATITSQIPQSLLLHPEFIKSLSTSQHSMIDIPKQCGLLTEEEIDITENYDAVALLQKITLRQLSSRTITTAFCKRAAISHQIANCLTEIIFEQAIARAAFCDEYYEREGKLLGPFHGLPISLNDSFNIKGLRSTLGYIDFSKRGPATEHSAVVEILLSQGAVLYAKTNVSQTLMVSDTHNNLFGRTFNPWRLSLTAGGSSGGAAALVALRGTVLALGTDIAGGVRLPAACCGVVGFKPSCHRIPHGGQTIPGRRGAFGIYSSAGPICHSVRDAEYFMRSILQFDGWILDSDALSVAWQSPRPGPLSQLKTFGIIFEDPKYPLHPSVLRNMQTILQKCSAAGHRLIPLGHLLPTDIIHTTALTSMTILNMDPDKTPIGYIARGGEPPVPSMSLMALPELEKMKPNINGVFNLNTDIANLRTLFRKIVVDNELDAILMPVYQSTAVPHDVMRVPAYTLLANILDYPACSLPFGKSNKSMDSQFAREVPYTPALDPEAVDGAPCAIQIIGRNMKDEDLLATAQLIETLLRTE